MNVSSFFFFSPEKLLYPKRISFVLGRRFLFYFFLLLPFGTWLNNAVIGSQEAHVYLCILWACKFENQTKKFYVFLFRFYFFFLLSSSLYFTHHALNIYVSFPSFHINTWCCRGAKLLALIYINFPINISFRFKRKWVDGKWFLLRKLLRLLMGLLDRIL